jgi:nucleotide-binding universal stress UspA family protein
VFDQILVPLDGSGFSEAAIPFALNLARANRSEVRLVHVIDVERHMPKAPPPDHFLASAHTAALNAFKQGAEGAASDYLGRQARSLRDEGISVSSRVLYGRPAEAISTLARKAGAEVAIIMTTHTHSEMGRQLVGSVADEILRTTQSPVFLLRPEQARGRVRRIVVALDGSKEAERPLPAVVHLAQALEVPVLLIQANQRVPLVYLDAYTHTLHEGLFQVDEDLSERYLQHVASEIEASVACECMILQGVPAPALVEFAATHPDSLMVITTRGGATKRGLGRVAYRLIQSSTAPLLVVPSPQPEPEWRVEDINA